MKKISKIMSTIPGGITNHPPKISIGRILKIAKKAEKLGKGIKVDENGKVRMIPKPNYNVKIDTYPGEDHYSVTRKQKV